MARYIDADKLSKEVLASWDKDNHKTIEASHVHRQEHHHLMRIIEKQPIADVVPKSEVERLQAEIRGYSVAMKYDAEHFMADINKLKAENDALIKHRDKLLQGYAREIFEEIEKIIHGYRIDKLLAELGVHIVKNGELTLEQQLAELKKKYTESEGKG